MTRIRSCLLLACSLPLAACAGGAEADPGEADAASPAGQWTRLIEGSWTLEAGGEIPELCIQEELEEDIYISAIRPVHPPGTHHTLLSTGDGTTGCNASLVANGLVYAAGVGSEGLELPEGVALKLRAGDVLNLGLHLFNTSAEDLSGTSAMEIVRLDPSEVEQEAEAVLAGPFDISIPPGRHSIEGECTLEQEQTVFAFFPHMHQLGVHFKAAFVRDGEEEVVHDAPYEFEEQIQIPIDPVTLRPGDAIRTECTWENPTASTVTFGESSNREMCFNIVFQYPARGRGFCGSGGAGALLDGPPCAEEGDPGNDRGVGRHCTSGGGQCTGTSAGICIADFVSGEAGNFCTTRCDEDADCGDGATCVGSGGRSVCFPTRCAESLTPAGAAADGG